MLKFLRDGFGWLMSEEKRNPKKVKYIAIHEFDFTHKVCPTMAIADNVEELEKFLSEDVRKEPQNYLVFELKDCLTVKSSTTVTKCEKC